MTDTFLRLTPLEVALSAPVGAVAEVVRPRPLGSARAALERAVLPAVRSGRCHVLFSGGRDSSLVLAVATAVARTAAGSPVGDIEIAGPEAFGMDEFARRALTFRSDPRTVVRDDSAPYYGAQIEERTLIPVEGAQIFATTLEEWLPLNPPRS